MNEFNKKVSFLVTGLMILNSVGVTRTALAADNTAALLGDVKTLESGIDSGKLKPTDAIDAFSQSIMNQNISINDVNAFVKTQMTDEQFQAFEQKMDSAMRGIDPATLNAQETGEIVGQALAEIHTEGLYWSGCVKVWTGAALIAAAVVTGIIAILKSKSQSSIRNDYQNKINDSNNSYNNDISNANNWKTAYPNIIQSDQNNINNDENAISSLSYDEANATTQAQADAYAADIRDDQADIANQQADINFYNSKLIQYATNPGQVAIDVQAYGQERDAAALDLQNQETAAIAAAPGNQALGEKLGIGAGIGAAIGAGMLVYGIEQNGCS